MRERIYNTFLNNFESAKKELQFKLKFFKIDNVNFLFISFVDSSFISFFHKRTYSI